MAKNFFYKINPTEVMAAAGFEADREQWFIQFFRDLMGDDPDKAETELAAEYIREAHDYRESRAKGGHAKASKYKHVQIDALQDSACAVHVHKDAMPVAVAVAVNQNPLPTKKASASSSPKKPTDGDPQQTWFTRWWLWAFERTTGDTYAFSKADAGIVKNLLKTPGFDQLLERACYHLLLPDEKRFPRGSPTLKGLAGSVNQYAACFTIDTERQARRIGLLPAEGLTVKNHTPWLEKDAA